MQVTWLDKDFRFLPQPMPPTGCLIGWVAAQNFDFGLGASDKMIGRNKSVRKCPKVTGGFAACGGVYFFINFFMGGVFRLLL